MVSGVPGFTSGYWVSAIQDLLGNKGASVTLDISSSQRSTPTARILPRSSLTTPSTKADIVSLSPEAQRAISNDQIALDLITPLQHPSGLVGDENTTASTPSTGSSPTGSFVMSGVEAVSGAQDSGPLATSIAAIVAAAQSTLSDPSSAFYQAFNGDVSAGAVDGPAALASTMPADEAAAFVSAFNNRTLTIQSAVDVPFIDYKDNSVLTGTSETAHVDYNQDAMNTYAQTAGVYSTMLVAPGIGALYVTWAKPSSANVPLTPNF